MTERRTYPTPTDSIPTHPVREWEQHVYNFLDEPIPPAVHERGERVVADVLAATVAGMGAETNATVALDAVFGDGPATLLGTGRCVPVETAALVHTAAAITPEVEEGHTTGGHVGASIVAGALGVAEASDLDGAAFVDACVRSYEVCTRLERAIFGMKARMNEALPWLVRNPHSTWTTVGPALTSALCLGLDRDALCETFRVAANLAVVSMFDPYAEGAPARNFTAGFSAQAGVSAALAAAAGLRGSAAAIGEVYDPFDAEGEFTADMTTLGERWEVAENYFKPYPSCRYTHAPLDALRAAVDGVELEPSAVEQVDVYTYRNGVDMAHSSPQTMTGAKFSTPYVVARYLASGSVDADHFGPEAVEETAVQRLADRVSLHVDEAFEERFPEAWGARVEVTTADGEQYTGSRQYPRGDYRDPLSAEEWRERTRGLLALVGAESTVAALETVGDRPVARTVSILNEQ